MSSWLELLRPGWLLLLLPLGLCLWLLRRQRRREGAWQQLLPPLFQPWLLSRFQIERSPWPWRLLLCGWLLAVLALAGPALQQQEQSPPRPAPLVVMLQLTPDLLATDLPPSRLVQVRRKLQDLLAARAGAPTAIVLYAGSAHTLLPLSTDSETGSNLLAALHPDLMPLAGQRADLAMLEALQMLERSGEGRGHLLLLTSSLDSAEQAGMRKALRRSRLELDILGIGTPSGAPVPGEQGLLRESDGRIRISRLDEAALHDFVSQLDGQYSRLRSDSSDLRQLAVISRTGARSTGTSTGWKLEDAGHWLLLPLLLLGALAGRRGWLLMLGGLLLLPPPAQAFEWQDLWLRPDQQGVQLLEEGEPASAATTFEDQQWQGIAWYAAGDYAAAARAFARGRDASAHYNLGNALAMGGELEAALEAWQLALQLDPGLEAARSNREQVLAQLARGPQGTQNAASQHRDDAAASAQQMPGGSSGGGEQPQAGSQAAAGDRQNHPGLMASALSAQGDVTAPSGPSPADEPDLEQWLRQIPDSPGDLLRRKFWNELQQSREATP